MPKKIEVPEGMAWCSRCKQALSKELFHKVKKAKTGVEGYCKKCRIDYQRLRLDQKPLVIPPAGSKYCPHCDTIKPDEFFREGLLKKKNLRSHYCKECFSNIVYREPRKNDLRGGKQYGINHQSFKPLEKPITTDQSKLAYAAALFDGEGCAQIMPSTSGTPIMTVSGNNECLINEFNSTIGGKVNFFERLEEYADGSKARISEGRATVNTLANVSAACVAMMPYLKVKKERCEVILRATESSPADRVALRDQINILNKRGISEYFSVPNIKPVIGYPDMDSVPDFEWAYLAGMIDGEGWIGIKKRGYPVIQIGMTRSESIVHIYGVFGGTIGVIKKEPPNADTVYIRLSFTSCDDHEWFLHKLSNFLILKKQHCVLAKKALGASVDDRDRIKEEMEKLTARSKLEKFKRVQNQIPELKKRLILDEKGIIVGIRDFKLEGDDSEIEAENYGGEHEETKQQEVNENVQAVD